MNVTALRVKANSKYTCIECGSTEFIQAHHVIPGDDDSLIPLCAECHSKRHPEIPHMLFLNKNSQSYWNNISAASLGKKWKVSSRTVIRTANKLNILRGYLSNWDEELIKNNIPKIKRRGRRYYTSICPRCHYLNRTTKPKATIFHCDRCGDFLTGHGRIQKVRQISIFGKNILEKLQFKS